MAYADEDRKRVADSASLQWRVLLADDEWQQATAWGELVDGMEGEQTTGRTARGRWWWIGVALLLALTIAGGAYLRQRALHNLAQVEQELTAAVDLEMWAIQNDRPDLAGSFLAAEDTIRRSIQAGAAACGDNDVHVEILSYELRGELARVEVLVSTACAPGPYRETRVYRQGTGGWQRTAANAELWGPWQTLESEHFVYHFRQLDAPTVAAAAPRLDVVYEEIEANWGPPASPTPQKLVVRLDLRAKPALNLLVGFQKGQLVVAAPSLFPLPADRSAADVLMQAVAAAMVTGRTNQVATHLRMATTEPISPWHIFQRNGLRLWQLWDLDLPLAAWRREIVDWIYDDEAAGTGLPVHYAEMCGLYLAWRISPLHLGIPLACSTAAQPSRQLAPARTLGQLTSWPAVSYDVNGVKLLQNELEMVSTPWSFGEAVAVATLIDYVVVTYGADALPRLLAAFAQHDSWTTLIPATFGVSVPTFEAGWQAFLQTEYGLTIESTE